MNPKRIALLNPPWTFEGSIYFGCPDPHLPLEYGYSRAFLERDGHEVLIVDAQLDGLDLDTVRSRLAAFRPDVTVVATAPSYLFWRCPPPELRVPIEAIGAIRDVAGALVAVGPHASTTPRATVRKLGVDVAVLGECEEVLPRLVAAGSDLASVASIAWRNGADVEVQGPLASADVAALPALRWPREVLARHRHHHHRFEQAPDGPGAEMETSRGCPYHCTFCAKDNFRDRFRRRPLETVLDELDGLIDAGAVYVYFIDEIFQPNVPLLEALVDRPIRFGIQMRIDLWSPGNLELLGAAGCVSIETGIESVTPEGRQLIDKKCRKTNEELIELLVKAKQHVPFVQASLMDVRVDTAEMVEEFRQRVMAHGVWSNKPVPLFPYPGSPDYTRAFGMPDDQAWERAHARYLELFDSFSDIQDERPLPLPALESLAGPDPHA